MGEERIFFNSGGLKIEGLLEKLSGDKGVVVTHPHPLYGGTMHNAVVKSIVRVYRDENYTTLRFNFRGVERSEGEYDNGIGEQEDVRSALKTLADLGVMWIDLAGYSFGAWVNAVGLRTFEKVGRMIMVSPPVGLLDFDGLNADARVRLVITGGKDEIAPATLVEERVPKWNSGATFRIIPDADHFYGGKTDAIEEIVHEFLATKGPDKIKGL